MGGFEGCPASVEGVTADVVEAARELELGGELGGGTTSLQSQIQL